MDPDSATDSVLSVIFTRAFANVLAIHKKLDSLGQQTVKMIQVRGQAEIVNHINRCVDLLRVGCVEFES